MTELMKKVKFDTETQNIYRHVAVFKDSKCHGNGMDTRIKLMNENALKTWLMDMISLEDNQRTTFSDIHRAFLTSSYQCRD
jgi:hypothetical protein